MSKTMINVKTDTALKRDAQKVADEMGLPLSVIINNYLRRLIQERRISFSAPLAPNKETAKTLDRITEDIRKGKNLSPAFDDVDDAIAWLEA